MGKRKRRGVPRFLSLHHRLLKSHAWHSLTPLQRCGYIEIAQLYDGSNNGRLAMSTRRLAGVIPCSKNSPILGELEDAGFIDTVRVGKYARNAEERLASEYRLTDLKCDVTGELPSRRYNERHRWEPSEPRPKRRPLSDAERAKRYRAQRHARHENCPSEWDGTAPVSGADNVTPLVGAKRRPRETAKNGVQKEPDVTKPAPPTGTLIHLTRGEGLEDTPIGTPRGSKPSLAQLAPGHSTCKPPKAQSLPPGWHWCRFDKCVVTNTGVRVPIVDHPLVGTSIERAALRFLEAWRGVGGVTLTPLGEAAAAILDSDTAAA